VSPTGTALSRRGHTRPGGFAYRRHKPALLRQRSQRGGGAPRLSRSTRRCEQSAAIVGASCGSRGTGAQWPAVGEGISHGGGGRVPRRHPMARRTVATGTAQQRCRSDHLGTWIGWRFIQRRRLRPQCTSLAGSGTHRWRVLRALRCARHADVGNAAGLPIGTQYVARLGDEATLFRLAGQLEQARPWSGRAPARLAGWVG